MTDVDVNTVPICTEERLLSANGTSALVSYSAPGIGSHVVYRITLWTHGAPAIFYIHCAHSYTEDDHSGDSTPSSLLTQTRVAGVKCSSASSCVCVCLCPHHRTKTVETTITKLAAGKLATGMDSPSWILSWVLASGYSFNIRSDGPRSQGHKVQNILKEIKWPAWVCTVLEWPASIFHRFYHPYHQVGMRLINGCAANT